MGIASFLMRFVGLNPKTTTEIVDCKDLFETASTFAVRRLCFEQCVNLIAAAMGRCEVRTYRNRQEVQEREYWLWNIEPNTNQSSTTFWQKLISALLWKNEALVITTRKRDGMEGFAVADEWDAGKLYPAKQREYKDVRVGETKYDKTFRENEVIHLTLHHLDAAKPLAAIGSEYEKLLALAEQQYGEDRGRKMKVHVSQIAAGSEEFGEKFRKIINDQVKPFFENRNAVIPEFDGYEYSDFGKTRAANSESKEIRALVDDVLAYTARALLIPLPLVSGDNQDTKDATKRFLTYVIDPIADQMQEEINRKRYGYERWSAGDYVRVDTSSIQHFDLFDAAANVEKLVGSGAYSINDVLRAAGQEPIGKDWADAHYMTLNIAGLGEAAKQL